MNIIVCIKQVVDTNDIKWTKNNTIDREGVDCIINPCDLLALETALRIKEDLQNTQITVISMGPLQTQEALKTAIALGCDRAILLNDKKFSGADTVATSRTISKAIELKCNNYDLIICGQYAIDGDTAQTGPSIAQKLNIEQITYVSEIKPFSQTPCKKIHAIRNAEDKTEIVETPLPALICVSDCPYVPRKILINGYIKAQDYKIEIFNADDIGLSKEEIGIKGSPTWVSKAFRAQNNRLNKITENMASVDVIKKLTKYITETTANLGVQNE